MPLRALLLDFDNTMMQTEAVSIPSLIDRFNELYSQHINQSLTMDIFQEYFHGKARQNLCEALSSHYGINIDFEVLYQDRQLNMMKAYRKYGVEMAENLLPTLQGIQQDNITLALVSNNPIQTNLTAMRFAKNSQGDELARLFGTYMFEAGDIQKPDPDVYHRALSQLDVQATDAVAIEDSHTGIQAAVLAGIPALGFTGFAEDKDAKEKQLKAAGAKHCFHHFSEVEAMLKATALLS